MKQASIQRLLLAVAVLCLGCNAGESSNEREPVNEGERLAYTLGCVNCHHQTPKQIINAPSLLIVKAYSFEAFSTLLQTGQTASGRDLLEIGSIMGIVAAEQFSYMTREEVRAVYDFLGTAWSEERALAEEAKIPTLYKAHIGPGDEEGAAPSN